MKRTSEFEHYNGCGHKDPDNCSGCALTFLRQDEPNYSAWPLAYMENDRAIPTKWKQAFLANFLSKNLPYVANLKKHVRENGARFTDGTFAFLDENNLVSIKEKIR